MGDQINHTTIMVPTFRRPELLQRCLRSCQALSIPSELSWDVVVVDNSVDAEARSQVEAFAKQSHFQLRYAHQPRPGIAAARNMGVSLCQGHYVAFLDDDEAARHNWLEQLHAARQRHNADAVFGRVNVEIPEGADWARTMLEHSIGRNLPIKEGLVPLGQEPKLGTGNSLFSLSCLDGDRTFDDALGLSGGEDSALIQRVSQSGGRLVWAPTAQVEETVLAGRATLRFLMERRFSSGQLRTYQQYKTSKGAPKVALWMVMGAGQAAVGSIKALTLWALRKDPRASLCELAAGAGKVLWFSSLRLNRYRRSGTEPSGTRLKT